MPKIQVERRSDSNSDHSGFSSVSSSTSSPPACDQPSHGGLPRILVVDDEPLIADTVTAILNRNGFHAEATYTGKRAIELAKKYCPDLVLSDVMMPQMDGVETAIAISKACPDTRIVLFSGQAATVEILARARERGYMFELLQKPIHPLLLIEHLRK